MAFLHRMKHTEEELSIQGQFPSVLTELFMQLQIQYQILCRHKLEMHTSQMQLLH